MAIGDGAPTAATGSPVAVGVTAIITALLASRPLRDLLVRVITNALVRVSGGRRRTRSTRGRGGARRRDARSSASSRAARKRTRTAIRSATPKRPSEAREGPPKPQLDQRGLPYQQ